MKKPRLSFRAFLAALLVLAAVPAGAADVKELVSGLDAGEPAQPASRLGG